MHNQREEVEKHDFAANVLQIDLYPKLKRCHIILAYIAVIEGNSSFSILRFSYFYFLF